MLNGNNEDWDSEEWKMKFFYVDLDLHYRLDQRRCPHVAHFCRT